MKERLKGLGISLSQIARDYGCSRQFVSKVLNGEKPMPEELAEIIAEKMGMEKTDFIYQFCYCKRTTYFVSQ